MTPYPSPLSPSLKSLEGEKEAKPDVFHLGSSINRPESLASDRKQFEAAMDGEELDFTLYTLPGCENSYSNSRTQLAYFAWRQARAASVPMNTHPRDVDSTALIRRANAMLNRWVELYGEQNMQWLPPAGIVNWQEDAARFLAERSDERFSGDNEVRNQVNKEGISSGVQTPGNSNGGKGDAAVPELDAAFAESIRARDAIEAKARAIYDGWHHLPGWVPWVEGGNSTKQDDARRIASRTDEGA